MSSLLQRRLAVAAGGAALIGMGLFTAGCSGDSEAPPATETTTTTTTTTTTEAPPPPPPAGTAPEVSPTLNRPGEHDDAPNPFEVEPSYFPKPNN